MQQCLASPAGACPIRAGATDVRPVIATGPLGVIPHSRWDALAAMRARVERGERVPP